MITMCPHGRPSGNMCPHCLGTNGSVHSMTISEQAYAAALVAAFRRGQEAMRERAAETACICQVEGLDADFHIRALPLLDEEKKP